MKRINIILIMIVFMLFSFFGCSNESISKIEVIDNTIKTNYIIGEEVEIDNFSLKVTLKNKKETIYNITKDMLTISEFDNTILGNQNVNMIIDYYGMNIELVISVNFDLPEEVKNIISLIDDLPSKDNVSFTNEAQIEIISNKYELLNEEYKKYITNYNEFLEVKNEYNLLKNEYITSEFINERFTLKTNLDNFLYSLNEGDYKSEDWSLILKIYDKAISELYLNENHQIIDNIANVALSEMKSIKTIEKQNFELLKEYKKKSIIEYRESLNIKEYSQQGNILLDSIVLDFINKIDDVITNEKLEGLYNETINNLNKVETFDEEKVISLNNKKDYKTNLVKEIFANLNLNNYSENNREIILNYYNNCLLNIKSTDSEETIEEEIKLFELNISKVKTLKIEYEELLEETKFNVIQEIKAYKENLNIYEYDSQNKLIIENLIVEAITDIENASIIDNVCSIKINLTENIENIPTMMEQAIKNLPNRIKEAKDRIDNYVLSLDINNYSDINWKYILNIADTAKNSLEKEITVSTSTITINNKIDNVINKINSIANIEQEKLEKLQSARIEYSNKLDEYYSSLNETNFNEGVIGLISSRIEDSKEVIFTLESIEKIVKLANDTIELIEELKIKEA